MKADIKLSTKFTTAQNAHQVGLLTTIEGETPVTRAPINLALVLAMARRVRLGESDFPDLIGEGNMALMRSVDKFDCGRGFKFSTYACRAILKAFSRFGIKLVKHRQRFPSEFDPEFERSNHLETVREQHARDSAAEVRFLVESDRADLSEVERKVIEHRFGLDAPQGAPSLTLEQVGQMIGVTKERVRQIQNKALEKIRSALQASNPDAAGAMSSPNTRSVPTNWNDPTMARATITSINP